jgi:hypothetical protein
MLWLREVFFVDNLILFLGEARSFPVWIISFLVVMAGTARLSGGERLLPFRGRILICVTLLFVSFVFFLLSFGLEEIEAVGSSARTAPRLWAAGLAFFTADQLRRTLTGRAPADPKAGDVRRVLLAASIVAFAIWGMNTAGFLLSSGGMILLLSLLFGERRPLVLLSLTGGWMLFSWFVFLRLLNLALPAGVYFG